MKLVILLFILASFLTAAIMTGVFFLLYLLEDDSYGIMWLGSFGIMTALGVIGDLWVRYMRDELFLTLRKRRVYP